MAKYIPRGAVIEIEFEGAAYEIPRSRGEIERIRQLLLAAGGELTALFEARSPDTEEKAIAVCERTLCEIVRDTDAARKITGGAKWIFSDYLDVFAFVTAQVQRANQARVFEYAPERVEL